MAETDSQSVLILMETGFILRNLLLGTFARTLAEQIPVTVAVLNPDDAHLRSVIAHPNIDLTHYLRQQDQIPSGIDELFHLPSLIYRVKQVEKNSAGMELQTKLFDGGIETSLKRRTLRNILLNIGRGIKVCRLNGWLDERYLMHIRTWDITQQWRDYFTRNPPAALVSTMLTHATKYAPSNDLPAVVAAHDRGIPVGTLVQSWDNLSTKASILPPWLDSVWTWSSFMSDELHSLYPRVLPNRIEVVGSPQFDFHLDPSILEPRWNFMTGLGLNPERPMIVIGTGTATWLPQEPKIVSELAIIFNNYFHNCQILVRLHPKDHGNRWQPYQEIFHRLGVVLQKTSPITHMDAGGFIPPLDFYREQINTLYHAAVVLNTASTLTVDASIVDCPVISIGYDIFPEESFSEGRAWAYNNSVHFSNLVKTGGVWVVRSQEECLEAVKQYLADPSLHREERRRIVEIVAGTIDGQAGYRLADAVLRLTRKSTKLASKVDISR